MTEGFRVVIIRRQKHYAVPAYPGGVCTGCKFFSGISDRVCGERVTNLNGCAARQEIYIDATPEALNAHLIARTVKRLKS